MFPNNYFPKKYFSRFITLFKQIIEAVIFRFITLRSIARYGMAKEFDIESQQGDSFDWEITIVDKVTKLPIDLTSYTVFGGGRKSFDGLDLFTYICTKAPDQVTNKGVVVLTLADEVTELLLSGPYQYNVKLKSVDGKIKTVYKGIHTFPAEGFKNIT